MEEFIIPLISFRLPEQMLIKIDELRDDGTYPSRAELIRTAIKDLLNEEKYCKKWGADTPLIAEQISE